MNSELPNQEIISLTLPRRKKRKKPKPEPEQDETGYSYTFLLKRVHSMYNVEHGVPKVKRKLTVPPPQMGRTGRKSICSNFRAICTALHRSEDHVKKFILEETRTHGSISQKGALILRGRYDSSRAESLIRKYVIQYVSCSRCKCMDTSLIKDSVTRLTFLTCEGCLAKTSVGGDTRIR